MSLGATARCRQSNIRRIALALFISSLLILTCPSPSRAQTLAHPPILIVGDQSFTPDNGVTNGNGTLQAPYIIENWEITSDTTAGIEIMNTNSYFVIRDVFIHPSHITPDSSGILLQNTLNGRVENSRIANFTYGVQLSLASQDSITSNRIWNNTYGVYMTGSADVIANNQIYNNTKYAVWATSTFNSIFTGNVASNNGDQADGEGFVIGVSSNNTFENNTVSSNTFYGFRTIFSTNNIFRNNNISKNQFGMIFTGSSKNLALNNSITRNDFGIGLENVGSQLQQSNNNVTTNRITGNGFGIYAVNSTRNTIYNNYLNNTNNASDDSSQNSWNITKTLRTNILGGPFQGGNFYSDYTGPDPDADGFGDTPYILLGGQSTQDILPLVRNQPSLVHDVAATSVKAQPTSARVGTTISITTAVFNEGTVAESFTASLYYNLTLIATKNVNLPALTGTSISQPWNTSGLAAGTYLLTANASIVPGEIDTANNISPPAIVSLTLNQPPFAKFTANPSTTLPGERITLDASQSYDLDGTIIAYAWEYGDGSPTDSGATPFHSYSTAGTYSIILTVTDNEGAATSTSEEVTILPDVPGIPENLIITSTSTFATLTWSPPSNTGGSPIAGYKIYRGTSPSSLELIATIGNTTSYTDRTVAAGQIFYYQVTAVNSDGKESPSSTTQDVLVPTNDSDLPNSLEPWYILTAAIVFAGLVGGVFTIRRRNKRSNVTTRTSG